MENKEKTKKPNVFRETFSASNGHLSSKRILGGIVLLVCLGIVVAASIREGITDNVKSLTEVLIITSTALLGITSVTNIWKQGKQTNKTEVE